MLSVKKTLQLISYWPPYLGAGVSVNKFDLDKSEIFIKLKRTPFNGNAFGTHFGGSLYSMCDPWYVFLALHRLGKGYIVWDVEANIKFRKAVKDPVYAKFSISDDEFDYMIDMTREGRKHIQEFETNVVTQSGELVADVKKKIYLKKKPHIK